MIEVHPWIEDGVTYIDVRADKSPMINATLNQRPLGITRQNMTPGGGRGDVVLVYHGHLRSGDILSLTYYDERTHSYTYEGHRFRFKPARPTGDALAVTLGGSKIG